MLTAACACTATNQPPCRPACCSSVAVLPTPANPGFVDHPCPPLPPAPSLPYLQCWTVCRPPLMPSALPLPAAPPPPPGPPASQSCSLRVEGRGPLLASREQVSSRALLCACSSWLPPAGLCLPAWLSCCAVPAKSLGGRPARQPGAACAYAQKCLSLQRSLTLP